MSNLNPQLFVDENYDAFKRLRVSPIQTLFESKLIHDKLPLLWDEELNLGGSSTYVSSNAEVQLGVPATSGAYARRQTFMRFPYQAGKSSLVLMTAVMGSSANTTRRLGQFNGTGVAGSNGLFFEHDGTKFYVCVEKNGTKTAVTQNDFNIDPFDGSGDSGITLDLTKAQIFFIDYEWLGVGRVRFGFVINGQIYTAHEFRNANIATSVYMSYPNLPLRAEISSQGSSGEMQLICSSVSQEGGSDAVARTIAIDTGNSFINAQSTSNKYAIIGFRQQSGRPGSVLPIEAFDAFAATNDAFWWQIQRNPTISGAAIVSTPSNTSLEKLLSPSPAGSALQVTVDGDVLASGYVAQQTRNVRTDNVRPAIWPGRSINGTRDEFWLTVQPLNNGLDVYGSLGIREIG